MSFSNYVRMLNVNVFIALLVLAAGWQDAALAKAPPSGFAALPKAQQAMLDDVEKRTFEYFVDGANTKNGLMPDHWPQVPGNDYFASIASVGFGLTAYGIGVERGWMKRGEAVKRTLAALRFFHDAPQSDAADAAGYHGFFYHFLDMETGKRFNSSRWVELSSVDTAWLMYGVLFAQSYYDRNTKDEEEIRRLADELFRRVDWRWFSDGNPLVQGGWTPENGFDYNYYRGYSEAFGLYILALGSPTHALGPESWTRWTQTYGKTWGEFQGQTHLGAGPAFWHQYTHTWIDFRGLKDDYMRDKGIDYFENGKRAALSQREYAIHNPMQWKDYGANVWGLTAGNGPRGASRKGEPDRYANDPKPFYGYIARGAGLGYSVDDGTIAPTAAIGSIAFAPEIVIPAIEEMQKRYGDDLYTKYGFVDGFNPSFTFTDRPLRTGRVVPGKGWFDTLYIGIDQGPIVTMIENYRSDFIWKTMRKNPYIREGLKRAGFTGGWLDETAKK
ncbi:MAG: Tat pathway signal protein [Rudaea sp.]|uniref:glucoamylase family protein n=2 Tax=unclassified Rudaea TaxID=2627037 RepID=UPI0014857574|nr:glucoamylase family protein [Rudaea sp.]MBN8885583.1 Tat pathway signal protein [Rudaea sp.]MBR0344082.1 Tat pathway signal protein [Rudaea sp.]